MGVQRFELKYLVTEETALTAREFVCAHLVLDEHCAGQPAHSYTVHDLYLDTDERRLYEALDREKRERCQLRLRHYDTDAESPVYFELKREHANCVFKQRGGVRREFAPELLGGCPPELNHLVAETPREFAALRNFCQLAQQEHAKPCLSVDYRREAYWNGDAKNQLRLTFDRDVHAQLNPGDVSQVNSNGSSVCYGGAVVLELKFTSRFPDWFRELIKAYGLVEYDTYKYVEAVQELGLRP